MWGKVLVFCMDLVVCVCVSVCVCYHSSGYYESLKAKVRYQQKELDIGNKTNVGIKLQILGTKVMTAISLS